jgi:transcriptional regulator with XRE-family HTH domain
MRIGKHVKKFREKRDLSIARLAALAGISPDYIFRIEHEQVKNIGIEKLSNIARALEIDVHDLLGPRDAA